MGLLCGLGALWHEVNDFNVGKTNPEASPFATAKLSCSACRVGGFFLEQIQFMRGVAL